MKSSSWQQYCDGLFTNSKLGFYLDVNNANLDSKSFEEMAPRFEAAFSAMLHLEEGKIANPDENRQVGHYWLRHSSLAPAKEIESQIDATLLQIQIFSSQILNGEIMAPSGEKFTHVLVIGIGGSALGPQFLSDSLGCNAGLEFSFLDNTDPDGIDKTLSALKDKLGKTLVIVISKSGGTAETRNGMLETQHQFSLTGLSLPQQAVAITGEGSELFNLATSENWLNIFPMWDWVGGRTSIMSAVGLLPASLMGIDIPSLLDGAKQMDELTRNPEIKNNPAALLAHTWYMLGSGSGAKDMVILPYKDRLILFSRYLQQLIMESIGKRLNLQGDVVEQGLSVYGNKGSTDQHAYIQQLRDGLDNFFVTFIEVLKDRQSESIWVDGKNTSGDFLYGFYKGTQTALHENNRLSITITISELSAKSIGALIALYDRAVGLYASLVNVNAYHQPGVEAGKKAAGYVLETKNQVLDLLEQSEHPLSIIDICSQLGLENQEQLIYGILRHHAANNTMRVSGSFYQPRELKVSLL